MRYSERQSIFCFINVKRKEILTILIDVIAETSVFARARIAGLWCVLTARSTETVSARADIAVNSIHTRAWKQLTLNTRKYFLNHATKQNNKYWCCLSDHCGLKTHRRSSKDSSHIRLCFPDSPHPGTLPYTRTGTPYRYLYIYLQERGVLEVCKRYVRGMWEVC